AVEVEGLVADVADDADDLAGGRVRRSEQELAADRALAPEVPLRQLLADDGSRGRSGAILLLEVAAGPERHLHRLQISRGDGVERRRVAIGRRTAGDPEREEGVRAAERQGAGEARAFDARQGAQALERRGG